MLEGFAVDAGTPKLKPLKAELFVVAKVASVVFSAGLLPNEKPVPCDLLSVGVLKENLNPPSAPIVTVGLLASSLAFTSSSCPGFTA